LTIIGMGRGVAGREKLCRRVRYRTSAENRKALNEFAVAMRIF